ncbi:EpsG family protein [Paenibacillus chungangensis]|uniref:EpsG family protein n=1 Tax=Paenibacillus chungangensis TaxID=696535 RepID=A0ABW3HV48_9BACL
MIILWASLPVVFYFAFFSRYFAVPSTISPISIRPNKILAAAAAVSLVLVSGLRNNIGDTFFYMHAYKITDYDWAFIWREKDKGFNILQLLLQQITDDPQLLIMTTALITNILIVAVMYQYSRLLELSLYLYITSGAFIVSMNGLRQYLAAAILFAGTKFLLEGRWKPYMLLVLLASIFHQSALILAPLYFIVRLKAWTKLTTLLLAGAIAIVLGYNYFSEMLFKAIQDTQYGHYASFQEGGANFIRVIVNTVPLFIAYMGREKLRRLFPGGDVFVNMSIIGVVLMIVATQNWIFARLVIYFTLYQLVLMGWIVKLFRDKDQRLVYFLIICLYFIYFFYENVMVLGINYRSDYMIWPF